MSDSEKCNLNSDDEPQGSNQDQHGFEKKEVMVGMEKNRGSRSSDRSEISIPPDEEAQRSASIDHESETNPGPVIVPRNKRRGWLASMVIIPEVEEPKNYDRRTKWIITLIVAIGAIAAPLGSAIIFRMLS
jgi:hypothetical protein